MLKLFQCLSYYHDICKSRTYILFFLYVWQFASTIASQGPLHQIKATFTTGLTHYNKLITTLDAEWTILQAIECVFPSFSIQLFYITTFISCLIYQIQFRYSASVGIAYNLNAVAVVVFSYAPLQLFYLQFWWMTLYVYALKIFN